MIDKLKAFLKEDQVITSQAVLEQHSKGESFDAIAVLPDVVLYPESTQDVQNIMRFAYENEIPVTPVAVNSSLEGHTVPLNAGISLDMMRMDKVISFQPENLLIVCQPALTYPQINDHARHSGLFFPIDPGAHASIGGMISTNASGTMAVRYGVTSDFVLALEIVTPTGEVIRTGTTARKSSSGYDLRKLYCGAEGTLGVITEVSLKLVGLAEAVSAARLAFTDATTATKYVTSLIQAGIPVARCELVDATSMKAVNKYHDANYPEEMTIFLEFQGNKDGIASEMAFAKELAEDCGALTFEASDKPEEQAKLWEARHNLYYAMVAYVPGKSNISTDMAVPISKLPEAVEFSLKACKDAGFETTIVGHVGDGNFHLLIFFDEDEAEQVAELNHQLLEKTIALGGTVTGEHGVGIRKMKYMREEHGNALNIMQIIKQGLDPKNIMNPGKKIPLPKTVSKTAA